jgi:FMN phosphatase YigB (HAD superfamily)
MTTSEGQQAPTTEDKNMHTLLEVLRLRGAERVERAFQVYCNRDINFQHVDAIGFDMDYTLAIYNQDEMDRLSVELTIERMIEHRGYPEELRDLKPDPAFAIRGLVVDKVRGNILKLDSHRHVGKAYHGFRALTEEELEEYKKEAIRFASDRYVERSPHLALTLHRFRSAGKKLFLLTNSYPEYTEYLMNHLLGDALPEYESWRQYFDVIIAGAHKPDFFKEGRPFYRVDDETFEPGEEIKDGFERGVLYQHGNLKDFVAMSEIAPERTVYVGDHIYGDILRSRKSSAWRTVMIVQEMEPELLKSRELREDLARIDAIEDDMARLTQEISQEQWLEHNIDYIVEHLDDHEHGASNADKDELIKIARKELRHSKDRMRRRRKDLLRDLLEAEQQAQAHFNPWWGLIFKMNNKNSLFGEQVEDYACLYTSRVSNFINYSPLHYFRAPRQPMAHEFA